MSIPGHLGHLSVNPFSLYGFEYNTIAHWIVIQDAARRCKPFKHFFGMAPEDLPEIHDVDREVLEEGLEAMLPDMEELPSEYMHTHATLGIGTTQFRLSYGDKKKGKNLYGLSVRRVLKRRRDL
jgi:hypothetical protein